MLVTIAGLSAAGIGCRAIEENPQDAVQAQTQPANRPVAVDVAIARSGSLATEVEYAGTTSPIREVSVRSRLEGRLLNLNVDIGDRVSAGQAIAQLDNAELFATVLQAEAEIAARRAEVAQANAAVGNARSQAERARLEYRQAQADANRFSQLAKQGAVSKQVAENALTQARAAEQIFFASEQQVRLQQQTVGAAAQRVAVQQAIRLREQERQSYTIITAPIDGVVLERMSETGNLLFPGNEVLKLGDFSQIKVVVQVSELEISQIRPQQPVDVRFDAIPNQKFTGRVKRISPAADPVARLLPVEVIIPNPGGKLGSGKLARVKFLSQQPQQTIIPVAALEVTKKNSSKPKPGEKQSQSQTATILVIEGDEEQPQVAEREVTLGDRRDGKVVILTGLTEGERVVVRSGGKLEAGNPVRISVLSEKES